MNAFTKLNMGEVTRLTRAGRLTEAMALLQGHAPAPAETSSPAGEGARAFPLPGEKWTRKFARMTEALRAAPHVPGGFSGLGRAPAALPEGARFEERAFSHAAGALTYKVYAPSRYAGQALPVVVMLHGCTQDPDDFAAGTRMNELAEEHSFLVVYPRQTPSANPQKCWNWFKAEEQRRGGGEPSRIAGVVRQVIDEFSADASRVYIAGLSAGGAAAAIMGAAYPDLFAAVGVHSGLACGAALDLPSAFAAMKGQTTAPMHGARSNLPTIVFHGDADRTVHPVNGDHVIAGAGRDEKLATVVTQGETPAGMTYTRTTKIDAEGRETLEQWRLHGAGHAWSGGSPEGSYTDPRGPDASREMVRFFLAHAKPKL